MLTFDKDIKQLIEVNKEKQNSLWFGGTILSATSDKLKGCTFCFGAYGMVVVRLLDRQTKEEIEYIKDKGGSGVFGSVMSRYISSDKELKLLLDDEHPTYELDIINNNWWEAYAIIDGITHDLGDIFTPDNLSEAIQELIDGEDNYIDYLIN